MSPSFAWEGVAQTHWTRDWKQQLNQCNFKKATSNVKDKLRDWKKWLYELCYLVYTVWVGDRRDAFGLWNWKTAAIAATHGAAHSAAHAGVSSLLIRGGSRVVVRWSPFHRIIYPTRELPISLLTLQLGNTKWGWLLTIPFENKQRFQFWKCYSGKIKS